MLIAVYAGRRKLLGVIVNSSAVFPCADKYAAPSCVCYISRNVFKRSNTGKGSCLVFQSSITARFPTELDFKHNSQYVGISVRHVNSNAQQNDKANTDSSNHTEKPLVKVGAKEGTPLVESRWIRFKRAAKNEALHYWHGSKLFWIDLKIATGLLMRIAKGEQLTRRERKQLARTTADMFRLVPFSVFVVVPFLELTLPLFLKLFPNMLPSTFAEEKNEVKNRHRILQGKLEMAKFLQDTLEQTAAVQKRTATSVSTSSDAKTITMLDFANFMHGIRASGKLASPDDIKKFSTLFEDELTLDTMTRSQLQACCKLLEISALGPIGLLRHRLRVRLRELEADDMLILKEGIESLSTYELQVACRERGMRSSGVSELRMRSQLHDWLTLNIKEKLPTTLLLLSRAMYIPENVPVEDQLTKVMSLLPDIAAVQAQLRAGERSGEQVSNTLIMEVIKKEQEAITRERAETRQAELALHSQLDATQQHVQMTAAQATALKQSDTKKLESAIQHVAGKQLGAALQQAELAELKQDILEYKDELKSTVGKDLPETKLSQQLTKRIGQLIGQVDILVDGLQKQRQTLAKEKMVAVDDLLRELARLQKQTVSNSKKSLDASENSHVDEDKWQRLLQVLDYDRDGQISLKDAVKLVEMLKDEKLVAIAEKDVQGMVEALRHESELEETNSHQTKVDERAS